jgi:hypothetical protein
MFRARIPEGETRISLDKEESEFTAKMIDDKIDSVNHRIISYTHTMASYGSTLRDLLEEKNHLVALQEKLKAKS